MIIFSINFFRVVNKTSFVTTGWTIYDLEFESAIKKTYGYFIESMVLLERLNLSILE